MLSKSALVACIWFSYSMVQGQLTNDGNCTLDGTDLPEIQSGMNNYVIDMLGGTVQFAYAIGQCTATSLIDIGKWYKYECGDMDTSGMSTVTKTEFLNDQCTGNGTIMQTFNETNMTEGNQGAFECSGYNTYAKTTWSLDADCGHGVTIYAALGACTNYSSNTQMNFYCSSNETIAQIFNFGLQFPSTTSLPSSSFFPTSFNATLPSLLNATLPSLLNATLPSLLNSTSLFNLSFTTTELFNLSFTTTSLFNATFNATFPMLNMTTTQSGGMMCADDAFCDKWIFSPSQCQLVAMMPTSGSLARVYGRMEECSTDIGSSSTMIPTDINITVTNPVSSTSTTGTGSSTTTGTSNTEGTSGAIRPSLMLIVGVLSSFFFLVSI